jgi:hypothetical protein
VFCCVVFFFLTACALYICVMIHVLQVGTHVFVDKNLNSGRAELLYVDSCVGKFLVAYF